MIYSSFNTGTSIPKVTGKNIVVTAALSGFTANGINIPSTTNPLYLANNPLLVTGSITNIAAGTIFHYYDRSNNSDDYL